MGVPRNTRARSGAAPVAALAAPVQPAASDALGGSAEPDVTGLAQVVRRLYGRPLQVLLVIDDDSEAALFADAAEESVLDVGVEVVDGVEAATAHLERATTGRRRRQVPDVVVSALAIDESHRLLSALRAQTAANAFPVVVLSDDTRPAVERRSFSLGASGHMRAPDRSYQRVALIHTLPDFLPQFRAAK
jgi:CheY-like chemotaxis protein